MINSGFTGKIWEKSLRKKLRENMEEMKEGKLKTATDKKVTSRKQAIAIGLSEARKEGDKVPNKPKKKEKSRAARFYFLAIRA